MEEPAFDWMYIDYNTLQNAAMLMALNVNYFWKENITTTLLDLHIKSNTNSTTTVNIKKTVTKHHLHE